MVAVGKGLEKSGGARSWSRGETGLRGWGEAGGVSGRRLWVATER